MAATLSVVLSDADVAALYDVLNPWDPTSNPADAFFHELVMSERDVLDVGCGTGTMLRYARDAGHTGRLVGIDPDVAALARAGSGSDIEWVAGVAAGMTWDAEFDLAIMASHAFQCLITDDDVRRSLAAIRRALRPGGRFAFDTRHPQAEAWTEWETSDTPVTTETGRALRVTYTVHGVESGVVDLSEVYREENGESVRADRSKLRFLDIDALNTFLIDAGFAVNEQFGDWDRRPIDADSREIVTIARAVS